MEEKKIIIALHRLGVPNHTKGYKNLIFAIQFVLDNDEELMVKEIVGETSRQCKETYARVERNMRHSIELADAEQKAFYQKLFGSKKKPPLKNFIITVAEYIKHPTVYEGK